MSALGIRTLRDLIDRLPAGERRLLLMRYSDGLSIEEIAGIEDLDIGHVEQRVAALEDLLLDQVQLRLDQELSSESVRAA